MNPRRNVTKDVAPAASIVEAALVGVGGTALMDLGAEVIKRASGVEPLDYALLGRWLGHMPRGKFAHHGIADSTPVRHERLLGQTAHYGIGIAIAVGAAAVSPRLIAQPRLVTSLGLGLATTAAPFLLMQPCFGLGVAASNSPEPWTARLRSLRSHAVYGAGLYLTAGAISVIRRLQTADDRS